MSPLSFLLHSTQQTFIECLCHTYASLFQSNFKALLHFDGRSEAGLSLRVSGFNTEELPFSKHAPSVGLSVHCHPGTESCYWLHELTKGNSFQLVHRANMHSMRKKTKERKIQKTGGLKEEERMSQKGRPKHRQIHKGTYGQKHRGQRHNVFFSLRLLSSFSREILTCFMGLLK